MKLRLLTLALLAATIVPIFAGNSSSRQKHKMASKEILKARAQKINGVDPLDKVKFFDFFNGKDLTDAEIKYAFDRVLINLYKINQGESEYIALVVLPEMEREVIRAYSPLKPLLYAILFNDDPEPKLKDESDPTDLTEELKKLKQS